MRELIGSLGMALVIFVAAIIVWGRLDALVQQEHEVVETLTRLEHDMNADFALVLKPVPQSAGNTTAGGGGAQEGAPPGNSTAPGTIGNGTAPVDDNSKK